MLTYLVVVRYIFGDEDDRGGGLIVLIVASFQFCPVRVFVFPMSARTEMPQVLSVGCLDPRVSVYVFLQLNLTDLSFD